MQNKQSQKPIFTIFVFLRICYVVSSLEEERLLRLGAAGPMGALEEAGAPELEESAEEESSVSEEPEETAALEELEEAEEAASPEGCEEELFCEELFGSCTPAEEAFGLSGSCSPTIMSPVCGST